MFSRRAIQSFVGLAALVAAVGCSSRTPTPAVETGSGTAAAPAAPVAADEATGSAPAADLDAGAAAPTPATAPVADRGVQGNYVGDLVRAGMVTANHPVTVMTDGQGQPQVGFWEFCNVDMVGSGLTFTAAPNSSCLVDLGDGQKPHTVTAGVLNVGDNKIEATITFDTGAVWTYTGVR